MPIQARTTPDFEGLPVAAFESRRAKEIAALIARHGGEPHVAPSMCEIPLEHNVQALDFGEKLMAGGLDAVIFMTGVGTTGLFQVLEAQFEGKALAEALGRTTVVARGWKTVRALAELGVSITIKVPEPNTWQELLRELDGHPKGFDLKGSRIALQEYGAPNELLVGELEARGAKVMRVPVYRWALPDDLNPLKKLIGEIAAGRARVVLFTNAVQVSHTMQVAARINLADELLRGLRRSIVCSIGPTCTEALAAHGLAVDLEPELHKMGNLIHEAARRAPGLLLEKDRHQGAQTPLAVSASPRTAPAEPSPRWHDSVFMKACRREPVDVTPIWLMRQAGRYMKEYRDLRARVPFLDLCKNPELVAEVTVTAAERIGADAAILFADILLIAEPMGFHLEYDRTGGPRVTRTLRSAASVNRLKDIDPHDALAYVFEGVRRTRASLNAATPLIGFAGAPFTLASYLIEGGSSKSFRRTKTFMFEEGDAWHKLMAYLARNLASYINGQIEAGVQAIQVFDSWVGCLAPGDYREYVLPHMMQLFGGITRGVPVIHFGAGTSSLLELMREAGGSIFGLDFRVELDSAWDRLGPESGVQGNLDPAVLYADLPLIREHAVRILRQAHQRPGHIFNLGHGVLPETPVQHVIDLVKIVHEESARLRQAERGT